MKTLDIKKSDNNKSYAVAVAKRLGEEYYVGLCSKKYHAHILTSEEIVILDILLCWKQLVDSDSLETVINLSDIDWLRNRHKKNKEHIANAHETYMKIFNVLSTLNFICIGDEISDICECDNLYPLLKYRINYSNGKATGITYTLGKLESTLNKHKQVTTLDCNVFKYRLNEDMKYRLIRYLVTSIFMNQVKSKTFVRTHKSILRGITYTGTGGAIETESYYDSIIDKQYIHKYLSRYITRLNDVLSMLKESGYIRDYTIERITNRQELITGCGKVEIVTNLSKKKKR